MGENKRIDDKGGGGRRLFCSRSNLHAARMLPQVAQAPLKP